MLFNDDLSCRLVFGDVPYFQQVGKKYGNSAKT